MTVSILAGKEKEMIQGGKTWMSKAREVEETRCPAWQSNSCYPTHQPWPSFGIDFFTSPPDEK